MPQKKKSAMVEKPSLDCDEEEEEELVAPKCKKLKAEHKEKAIAADELPIGQELDDEDENEEDIEEEEELDENGEDVPKNGNNNNDAKSADAAEETELKEDHEAEEDVMEKYDDGQPPPIVGSLIICGGTNWDMTGRKELPKSVKPMSSNPRNLWGPHCWAEDVKVKAVITSCTACHSVIVTEDGRAMTFGRNDKGQCGVGDTATRFNPVYVEGLKNEKIITAATGKGHTLFLNDKGLVFACGDNKMGQLGIGSQSANVLTPTRVSHSGVPIVKLACGAEFSTILDAVGALYTFGSPEYGQLGHNSEGKFFSTSNKISYNCETVPRRVVVFIEKTREGHIIPLEDVSIVDVSCGINHTLACDSKKRCFTWGFAGYGRLGHNETKDEMMPRNLKTFDYINRGIKRVWGGGTYCLALDENGMLYFWGQTKSSGEATMYPKPVQDLGGWDIRSVGAGNRSIVVAADESVISWGPSPTYGELGYGENRSKSSTTPQELKLLEGIHIHKVIMGFGHSLMIARADSKAERDLIERLPTWP